MIDPFTGQPVLAGERIHIGTFICQREDRLAYLCDVKFPQYQPFGMATNNCNPGDEVNWITKTTGIIQVVSSGEPWMPGPLADEPVIVDKP